MKKYLYFLLVSYAIAFLFELNANLNFDGKLFQVPGWPIVFLIWYGLFYSIIFFLLKNKPLWIPVITGAILGTIVEAFLFHRLNIIMDPIVYAKCFLSHFGYITGMLIKINFVALDSRICLISIIICRSIFHGINNIQF